MSKIFLYKLRVHYIILIFYLFIFSFFSCRLKNFIICIEEITFIILKFNLENGNIMKVTFIYNDTNVYLPH